MCNKLSGYGTYDTCGVATVYDPEFALLAEGVLDKTQKWRTDSEIRTGPVELQFRGCPSPNPVSSVQRAAAFEIAVVLGILLSHVSSLSQVALLQAQQGLQFTFTLPTFAKTHFRPPLKRCYRMQQQLKSLLTWSPGPDDLPPFRRARAAYGESVAMAAKLYSKPIPDETPNQQAVRTEWVPV